MYQTGPFGQKYLWLFVNVTVPVDGWEKDKPNFLSFWTYFWIQDKKTNKTNLSISAITFTNTWLSRLQREQREQGTEKNTHGSFTILCNLHSN